MNIYFRVVDYACIILCAYEKKMGIGIKNKFPQNTKYVFKLFENFLPKSISPV